MTDLLSFLQRIDKSSLKRAPKVPSKRGADFSTEGSPYKPLLLLAVIRQIGKNTKNFKSGIISFEDCVEPFFEVYSEQIKAIKQSAQKPEMVVQPFWYFGAGVPRIWELIPADNQTSELKAAIRKGVQIKTEYKLDNLVAFAEISLPDMLLIKDKVANKAIQAFILKEYFSNNT
jgi:predicted restriction endonuclease